MHNCRKCVLNCQNQFRGDTQDPHLLFIFPNIYSTISPLGRNTCLFFTSGSDKKQADVVCEHLKCGQSKGLPSAGMFSQIENHVVLKPTHCSNTEHQKHIWQCITNPKVVCTEPVSVICSGKYFIFTSPHSLLTVIDLTTTIF